LKKYPIEQITAASNWLVHNREESFPPVPKVPEFESAIKKLSGSLNGKTKAEFEADKVLKNLNFFGRECPTQFKDSITAYLMTHRWSFHRLGMMTTEDLKWWRKDFVDAYQDTDSQKELFLDTAEKAGMIQAPEDKRLIPVDDLKKIIHMPKAAKAVGK